MLTLPAKQKLLLNQLISSADIFSMCAPLIKPSYFDPEFRNGVKFIQTYYDKYHVTPTPEVISAETELLLENVLVTKDQIDYCCHELEAFCREQAMVAAVLKSADLIEKQDFGQIEGLINEALEVSLKKTAGVNFFTNPEQQLNEIIEAVPYSLGWDEFDDVLEGGLRRREMLLLSANSGGGKSVVMANIGLLLAQRHKLNVLYISLELPIQMIYKRLSAMVSGIAPKELSNRVTEAATKITIAGQDSGDFIIERMPAGTKPRDIRAYLKQFFLVHGYYPDVMLVDYLDKMDCDEKVNAENVHLKDKLASEQLQEIFYDYNMIGASASQQTRGAATVTEHNHSHIAGGISKINETDIYISILMTPQMQAAGQIAFQFLKTRSTGGVGTVVYMRWNRIALRVEPSDNVSKKTTLTYVKGTRDSKLPEKNTDLPLRGKGDDISSAFNV